MKKTLITIVLMCCCLFAFSQEKQVAEQESTSKTIEFMKKDGTLLQREFYPLGKVKGVDCQVLIITDLISKKKIGCLRLETQYSSSYNTDTYIGTLDYDEIAACIKSINYINENLLNVTPTTYTEVEYNTRDKVKVGAYSNEKKGTWSAYVQTKSYTTRSLDFFAANDLQQLVSIMEQAKSLIEEKIK